MAGYVKVWTTLRTNKWWLSCSWKERSIYAQMLLLCKDQRDDGTIILQSWSIFAAEMSCDVRSLRKSLANLEQKCGINVVVDPDGVIIVTIPKYKYWQEITVKQFLSDHSKNASKIPPLRPDQTIYRPDQCSQQANSADRINPEDAEDGPIRKLDDKQQAVAEWLRMRFSEPSEWRTAIWQPDPLRWFASLAADFDGDQIKAGIESILTYYARNGLKPPRDTLRARQKIRDWIINQAKPESTQDAAARIAAAAREKLKAEGIDV